MYFAKLYSKQDFKVGFEYYKRMRKTFAALDKKYDMEKYIDLSIYDKFVNIIKLNDLKLYFICANLRFKGLTTFLFSINNFYDENSKKMKVLTLFGKKYIIKK